MKYGAAFAILAALIAIYAIRNGGWFYLLLWPALSFGLVAVAYLNAGSATIMQHPHRAASSAGTTAGTTT
jgi:hypothetical protein